MEQNKIAKKLNDEMVFCYLVRFLYMKLF